MDILNTQPEPDEPDTGDSDTGQDDSERERPLFGDGRVITEADL